jgi:hypothetical protein
MSQKDNDVGTFVGKGVKRFLIIRVLYQFIIERVLEPLTVPLVLPRERLLL